MTEKKVHKDFTSVVLDKEELERIDLIIKYNLKIYLDRFIDEQIRYKVSSENKTVADNAVSEDDFTNICELQAGYRRSINSMSPIFNFVGKTEDLIEEAKDEVIVE